MTRGTVVLACDEQICRVRFSMVGRRHENVGERAAADDLQRAIGLASELGWSVRPGPTTGSVREAYCPKHAAEHADEASRKESTRA